MTATPDIKKLRESLGWSQEQLAEYLGIDRSGVSRMEHGKPPSRPVGKLLEMLAATPPLKAADPELTGALS